MIGRQNVDAHIGNGRANVKNDAVIRTALVQGLLRGWLLAEMS